MEETFGPTIGIMKVESDDEALALMNDSPYGLVRGRGPSCPQATLRHPFPHPSTPPFSPFSLLVLVESIPRQPGSPLVW